MSPSFKAPISKVSVADTFGSFLLVTTNTFKPFGNTKVAGSVIFITPAGKGFGGFVLSSCACAKNGKQAIAISDLFINDFIFVLLFI